MLRCVRERCWGEANTPPFALRLRPLIEQTKATSTEHTRTSRGRRPDGGLCAPFALVLQAEGPADDYGPPAPSPVGRPMCDSAHSDGPREDKCDMDHVCNKVYLNDYL
jgi:hypothetical protein